MVYIRVVLYLFFLYNMDMEAYHVVLNQFRLTYMFQGVTLGSMNCEVSRLLYIYDAKFV